MKHDPRPWLRLLVPVLLILSGLLYKVLAGPSAGSLVAMLLTLVAGTAGGYLIGFTSGQLYGLLQGKELLNEAKSEAQRDFDATKERVRKHIDRTEREFERKYGNG